MMKVKNPTKTQITLWWGHTPYTVNPGEVVDLPKAVARDCLKHNDYKGLVEVNSDGEVISEAEAEPVAKPWDDEGWDPLSAPEEELRLFADDHNMVWNAEEIQTMRDAIYERLMEVSE